MVRNGHDWSVEFAAITAAVMAIPFARIVLDGSPWPFHHESRNEPTAEKRELDQELRDDEAAH
jgi:hypothetical protein